MKKCCSEQWCGCRNSPIKCCSSSCRCHQIYCGCGTKLKKTKEQKEQTKHNMHGSPVQKCMNCPAAQTCNYSKAKER